MSEIEYFIYTDGSGHQDGFGGWSSLVVSEQHNIHEVSVTACKGTTTDRAEFEALLAGLNTVLQYHKLETEKDLREFRLRKPAVLWTSDRQSLVGSIQRDVEGNTINGRNKMLDLWARFEFYEELFTMHCRWLPRESNPYHSITDMLSSDARVLIKNFMELPDRQASYLLAELPKVTVDTA